MSLKMCSGAGARAEKSLCKLINESLVERVGKISSLCRDAPVDFPCAPSFDVKYGGFFASICERYSGRAEALSKRLDPRFPRTVSGGIRFQRYSTPSRTEVCCRPRLLGALLALISSTVNVVT